MTEDVSASDVDEPCKLEAETAREIGVPCTSCSCQRRISELEETITTLQEEVKQSRKMHDESKAEKIKLKMKVDAMTTEVTTVDTSLRLVAINFLFLTLKPVTRMFNFTLVCPRLLQYSTIYLIVLAPIGQDLILYTMQQLKAGGLPIPVIEIVH